MGSDELLADVHAPYPFRRHQQEALDVLDEARSRGRARAWVVLPPGAGKTLVGLEVARRRGDTTLVLGPNTAIQGQWLRGWDTFLPAPNHPAKASDDRDLSTFFTALTYQSLATFDPDVEVDEEGEPTALMARLHPNGKALVAAMKQAGPLTLVLDECHHLLEVWGRLLSELLAELPEAFVLGLTATPPAKLTQDQAGLVDELFGEVVYEVSIPAVVREGHLAPFAELAWLTTPSPSESAWLSGQAERFTELVHQLTDPKFGSISLFQWMDRRFVEPVGTEISWHRLTKEEPLLCSAALRMHRGGYLALPEGARLLEEHRHPPTADDWVLLVDDWLRKHLTRSGHPADLEVVERVRRALPSVGYQWTRSGIRKGRSPVDRVLARSEAKTDAVVEIVSAEHRNLAGGLRMLVLCDHERATATLPADLEGVLAAEAGSAHLVLEKLLTRPATASLHPMLVSGSTVAASPGTLADLRAFIAEQRPELAAKLSIVGDGGMHVLEGAWTSRQWVRWVTRFFESGGSQVLVGTRGLLGEGWDARAVTGLVDLTAATTATAVVQTRGRALRVDPNWPEKVALTWTVVCVAEEHPKGGNDWERFVRKHTGFFGVDDEGHVVDGVAHVDAAFSPYAPPPVAVFHAVNARMVVRSENRDEIAELWRVGTRYDDVLVHTVRIIPGPDEAPAAHPARHAVEQPPPPRVVMVERGLSVRGAGDRVWRPHPTTVLAVLGLVIAALAGMEPALALVGATLLAGLMQTVVAAHRGRELARLAARRPTIGQVASAVADGLHDAGMSPAGAEAVRVQIDEGGEYHCSLADAPEEASARFAMSLDEVVSPMTTPRYVLPRYLVGQPSTGPGGLLAGLRAATGTLRPTGEVWHSVPTVLGTHRRHAQAFAKAWDRWVGGGPAIYTGSAVGEGVLVTHRGRDPFAVTTVLRVHWR